MAQPNSPRPNLRRQSSKVRFSRGDMSPVGTMVSDTDAPGGSGHDQSILHAAHRPNPPLNNINNSPSPQSPRQGNNAYNNSNNQQAVYDINSYPFDGSTEISLSQSRDQPPVNQNGRWRDMNEDQVPLNPYENSAEQDRYTSTPPRPSARRWTDANPNASPSLNAYPSSPTHRPTLGALVPPISDARYASADISPRNTMGMDSYQMPPVQTSEAQRPSSTLRPSIINSFPSPQRTTLPEGEYGSPRPSVQGGSPIPNRPSIQSGSPAPNRPSVQPGSPVPNRPSIQSGSPGPNRPSVTSGNAGPRRPYDQHRPSGNMGSPRPEPLRSSMAPGYRRAEYEERTGLTPAPDYGSPRNSYFTRDLDNYPQDQRYGRVEPDFDRGRYDSDATLRGEEYDEKTLKGPPTRRPRASSDTSDHRDRDRDRDMRRRSTKEMESAEQGDQDQGGYAVKGGIFSQLLRLTGRSAAGMRRRQSSSKGIALSSRNTSTCGELPTMHNLGLKRTTSVASTTFGGGELDADDPRVTGQKPTRRRASFSDMLFRSESMNEEDLGPISGKRRRRASIQKHVADILTRQQFILKLAKALMTFGAPSHRLESQLAATSVVLELDAQFIHIPSIVIVSFGDTETKTSETVFIKASGGLELGKLHKVHNVYKAVVHDEMEAAEGTRQIHELLHAPKQYNVWQRIALAFLCSGIIAPMAFGGSFIDGLASGALGTLLAFMQLHVASKNALYSNVFEISIATVVSFAARGLATTGLFCYQAVCSAGVVLILPGYAILCGSLELASKNIVSGSVRMVYAIIYSLFLGFGITIGSDLFYVIDRPARRADALAAAAMRQMVTIHGQFSQDPGAPNFIAGLMPFNGTFTFSNSTTDDVSANLNKGNVICNRALDAPWWRSSVPQLYNIGFVPLFSLFLCLWNMQPLKSRQLPVMVFISCVGYASNAMANHYIFDRSDVVSAIGAFVIGILGNVYSRAFGGTAFTSMVTGVLFLVPSGMAAAGGVAMTQATNHDDSYSQGLVIAFRMITVAIGITVGLFGSGLLIYSFGRKKGAALFAF